MVKHEKQDWAQFEKVIVFDGVCNFCNVFVDFIMGHDPQGKFKFGTLQSGQGQEILTRLGLDTKDFENIFTFGTGAGVYQIYCSFENCQMSHRSLATPDNISVGSSTDSRPAL